MQCEKTYLQTCWPSAVWSESVVCMKKLGSPGYLKCTQWRFWSDCVNAQADLTLCWAHLSKGMAQICLDLQQISSDLLVACCVNIPADIIWNAGLGGTVWCVSDCWSGGRGFDPRQVQQQSFVEIDNEIVSTVILSLLLIQEGQLSVSGERVCLSTG